MENNNLKAAIKILNREADKICKCVESKRMCISCASYNALQEFQNVDSNELENYR